MESDAEEQPKPHVRLIDIVISVGIYGLLLALVSRGGKMIFNYFSISFCIALFFLTFRTYGNFRSDPLIAGVVMSQLYSAVGHLVLLLFLGGQWHVMGVNRNLPYGNSSAFLEALDASSWLLLSAD